MRIESVEILIIGAGPAGAVAAGLLRKQGRQVLIVEREQFPRFSIGESLLPQCMQFLEAAGFLQDVIEAGFQFKNGAAFCRGERTTSFDFRDKFSPGWGTTYQVQRADFDYILAKAAAKAGAEIRYRHQVVAVDIRPARPVVEVTDELGERYQVSARKVLDASGFGRILPRLLDLETPSSFPVRAAVFTHIGDGIRNAMFDRNKILVTVHPRYRDVWYWTIPFSNGRASIGVVAEAKFLERYSGSETERLQAMVAEAPTLAVLLCEAQWDTPARKLVGYAANVKTLWGPGFALLGNAGEFLDPVFSSGVTIALKSATLAASVIDNELSGRDFDWQTDYADPLRAGVDAFRAFVESWYRGTFQDIIFHHDQSPEIRRMISAILAGYAWDLNNPYVAQPRRLGALEQLCAL
jgi:flavin-dependent dehydrogenase